MNKYIKYTFWNMGLPIPLLRILTLFFDVWGVVMVHGRLLVTFGNPKVTPCKRIAC